MKEIIIQIQTLRDIVEPFNTKIDSVNKYPNNTEITLTTLNGDTISNKDWDNITKEMSDKLSNDVDFFFDYNKLRIRLESYDDNTEIDVI